MKKCSKCEKLKPIADFSLHSPSKKDGKYRPDCKECVRQRSAKSIDKERLKIVKENAIRTARHYVDEYLKLHPCVDCSEPDIEVLDFDHVRGDKVSDVSKMVSSGSRVWKIEEEINKCEVRCANCHRRVTNKRRRA